MKRRMNWINSLRTKLILIICIVLIPMNIIMIGIAQRMINNVQRELITSYEDELAIYMTRVDDSLSDIDRQLKAYMEENWPGLMMDPENAELARYTVWSEMKDARENMEYLDAAYLKTNWDNNTVITYDTEQISFYQSEELQSFLSENEMEAYQTFHFEVVEIEGTCYLMDTANYRTCSFGMITNVESVVSGLSELQNFEGEQILLVDQEGNSVSDTSGCRIDLTKNEQFLPVSAREENSETGGEPELSSGGETEEQYLVISYPSSVMDYYLVRLIPESQLNTAVPQMEKWLRISCFVCLLLIPIMIFAIRRLVLRPMNALKAGMHEVEKENLDYRLEEDNSSSEFKHINHVFNNMVGQIQNLRIESYEKDIEKLKVETVNLRLQINPHLLLNSLNMIYSLAQSKNYEVITRYTLNLVEYFRYSLRTNDELVTVGAEMQFVKNFLDIQKIRFPGAFTHVYELDEELDDALIPPLLIQNFVENSVKYALKMGETIEIIVIVKSAGDRMDISILDTGNGMKPEVLEKLRNGETIEDRIGTHIGIWNCRRRLKVFYGEDAEMTISSAENEGTQVWISVPVLRQEHKKCDDNKHDKV